MRRPPAKETHTAEEAQRALAKSEESAIKNGANTGSSVDTEILCKNTVFITQHACCRSKGAP